MQGVERFGRFNKHGSIVDLPQTPEICMLSATSHAEICKILLRVLNALKDSTNTDRQQTFSKLFKYVRFTKTNSRLQQTLKTPRTHESPSELARQNEAKRMQPPQREANVCRRKCNLGKASLINCTGHPIMHRTPNINQGLRSRISNAIIIPSIALTSSSCQLRFTKILKIKISK